MSPTALNEIPTLTLLYRLAHLHGPPQASTFTPSAKLNGLISLVRTDITTLEVGAVVNAANNSLLGGGGVDGAIHRAAGPRLLEECETLDGCATGAAKITAGYELPAEHVIHAVGPVYWNNTPRSAKELLRGCYRTSLELAREHKVKSIAFSAISTGVYGYPPMAAADVAIREVRRWVDEQPEDFGGLERIVFCCFERKDEAAYSETIPRFFPPTEEDGHADEREEAALIKSMPDPPTGEPTDADAPPAKVAKTESRSKPTPTSGGSTATSTKLGDDWVAVSPPPYEDTNGYADVIDDRRSTSIGDDVMTQEEKEQHNAALHTAQLGGDPPRSWLERDW